MYIKSDYSIPLLKTWDLFPTAPTIESQNIQHIPTKPPSLISLLSARSPCTPASSVPQMHQVHSDSRPWSTCCCLFLEPSPSHYSPFKSVVYAVLSESGFSRDTELIEHLSSFQKVSNHIIWKLEARIEDAVSKSRTRLSLESPNQLLVLALTIGHLC